MSETFDPYYRWLGIPPAQQPPNRYRLLGLDLFESDLDVIRDAADRQMGHVRHYQLGKHADLSQRILNELGAARSCLLDPDHKAAYDEQLRARLAPPGGDAVPMAGLLPAAAISREDVPQAILVSTPPPLVSVRAGPPRLRAVSTGPLLVATGLTVVALATVVAAAMILWSRRAEPSSRILLSVGPRERVNLTAELDGRVLAIAPEGDLAFECPPGDHVLRLARPNFQQYQRSVSVAAGGQVVVTPQWVLSVAPQTTPPRDSKPAVAKVASQPAPTPLVTAPSSQPPSPAPTKSSFSQSGHFGPPPPLVAGNPFGPQSPGLPADTSPRFPSGTRFAECEWSPVSRDVDLIVRSALREEAGHLAADKIGKLSQAYLRSQNSGTAETIVTAHDRQGQHPAHYFAYVSQRRDGPLRAWSPTGQKRYAGQFANGQRTGVFCLYEEDQPRLLAEYRNDECQGMIRFDVQRQPQPWDAKQEADNPAFQAALAEFEAIGTELDELQSTLQRRFKEELKEQQEKMRRKLAAERSIRGRQLIQDRMNQRAAEFQDLHSGLFNKAMGR